MPWARVDDTFWRHEKTNAAGPLGVALFAAALSYCNDRLTDGFIPETSLWQLVNFQGLSDQEGPVTSLRVAERLITAGLWHRENGGYRVHDYLIYNKTGEQIRQERQEAKDRMRGLRSSREVRPNIDRSSETPVNPDPVPGHVNSLDPTCRVAEVGEPSPPTTKAGSLEELFDQERDEAPPEGGRPPTKPQKAAKAAKPLFESGSEAYELSCHLRTAILRHDPQAKVPDLSPPKMFRWAAEIDRLIRIDGRDPPTIRHVIDWCQADDFWWTVILSPGKLREKFTQVNGQMNGGKRNGRQRVGEWKPPPIDPDRRAALIAHMGGDD